MARATGGIMRSVSELPFRLIEDPDMGIVLSDGCRLSARVWLPEGAGPVPAVLEYIPYRRRNGTLPRDGWHGQSVRAEHRPL